MPGKSALLKPAAGMAGMTGRAAHGLIAGGAAAPIEGATEYGQTLIEEYGKGNDPTSPEARKQALDAAALGTFGGAAVGGMGGAVRGAQPAQVAPMASTDPVAPASDPLQIGNQPDPYIGFPDGSVGKRADVDAYIASLPDERRVAARAQLAGFASQPVDTITPSAVILAAQDIDTAIAAQAVDNIGQIIEKNQPPAQSVRAPAAIENVANLTPDTGSMACVLRPAFFMLAASTSSMSLYGEI